MKSTLISPLKDTVFEIIDSRIQFIEYEQKSLLEHYEVGTISATIDQQTPILSTPQFFTTKLEVIIEQIAHFSKSLRLLLTLRSHLKKENAAVILDLLTNNQYLDYTVDKLIMKLILHPE